MKIYRVLMFITVQSTETSCYRVCSGHAAVCLHAAPTVHLGDRYKALVTNRESCKLYRSRYVQSHNSS